MSPCLSRSEARTLIDRGGLVVDVRSVAEYAAGHVPGSLNLPLHLLPALAAESLPRDRPLLLCCASGARSGSGAAHLQPQGYEAYNLGPWGAHPDLT